MSDIINILKEAWELRKHIKELSDSDYTKLLSLSFPSEGLISKLESDVKQSAINNLVLDYSSE
jgi:hypothetical protein